MDENESYVLIPKPVGYEEALKGAWEELKRQSDDGIVFRKNVVRVSERVIEVPFLNEKYVVEIARQRALDTTGKEVPPFFRVLLLHYLCGFSAANVSGEWVSFRQLRGGDFYFPAFANRTVERLKKDFNGKEGRFQKAAEALGGRRLEFKDISFEFAVFPKVHLAVILHCMTEEFGADANILFDRAAESHLETEDLAVCASFLVSRIGKIAKSTGD